MNPMSLANLLSTNDTHQPETQCLIPTLLPIGLTLLLGQPHSGKSWLALHLALSTTLGDPALGQLPTSQADVLYLGLQDTPQRMCTRTRKLLDTRPAPNNFTWTNEWTPSASAADKIAALDLWLTAFPRIRLLVIDSLDQLSATPSSITAQDTPQQELALVHQLKALASHHRIAILLVTQLSAKTSRHSPNELMHTPMLALADALLILKRNRGQADATLLLTSTDLPDQELALRLPPDTMCWTLLGPANEHLLSQERQDILTLLQEYRDGPLKPKEIASHLHKDVRAVTKLLFDMSHASQVRLIGRGQYMTIKSNDPTTQPPSSTPSIFGNIGNESNESNHTHQTSTTTPLTPSPTSTFDIAKNSNDSNNSNQGLYSSGGN